MPPSVSAPQFHSLMVELSSPPTYWIGFWTEDRRGSSRGKTESGTASSSFSGPVVVTRFAPRLRIGERTPPSVRRHRPAPETLSNAPLTASLTQWNCRCDGRHLREESRD